MGGRGGIGGGKKKMGQLGLVAQGYDPKYTRGRYKRFRM